jgi:hypothetical protein
MDYRHSGSHFDSQLHLFMEKYWGLRHYCSTLLR